MDTNLQTPELGTEPIIPPVRIICCDAHNWSVQVWQEGGNPLPGKGAGKLSTAKWVDRSYSGKLEFAVKWAIEEAAPIGVPITNDVLKGIEANILKETRALFAEVPA